MKPISHYAFRLEIIKHLISPLYKSNKEANAIFEFNDFLKEFSLKPEREPD